MAKRSVYYTGQKAQANFMLGSFPDARFRADHSDSKEQPDL
jgi:hypothetical protein